MKLYVIYSPNMFLAGLDSYLLYHHKVYTTIGFHAKAELSDEDAVALKLKFPNVMLTLVE